MGKKRENRGSRLGKTIPVVVSSHGKRLPESLGARRTVPKGQKQGPARGGFSTA